MSQRIKVFIRPKPLNKEQIKTFVSIDYANGIISLSKPNEKVQNLAVKDHSIRSFAFTKIFSHSASQQEIYQNTAFSLIENVLEGYNGTIFAYGQTGSGKTYSIMGGKDYLETKMSPKGLASDEQADESEVNQFLVELKGIIPRSFSQIITVINSQKDKKHLIQCSFIEIYNQNVHDLLGDDIKTKLSLKENATKGLVIEGLKTFLVKSVEELERQLRRGYRNRSVRQTSMNKESSRSHCIFSIKIEEQTTDAFGNAKFKVGKLNLVDLAGSERQSKMSLKEQGLKEATKINLSLSALGKVINCLSNYRENQKNHIPYRDSKLTRILQDSLGGNTKTVMIATISQNSTNYEETLSTLIYASRARFIQNKPVMNQDPKDVLLREYVQEIEKLKLLLLEKQIENEGLRKTSTNFKPIASIRPIKPIHEVEENYNKQQNNNSMEEEEIKKKLQNLENIVKKESVENEESKKELQKLEVLKKKIKLQEEREAELERQKRQRELELESIEKNYNDLNEQADILRNKFKDLKGKYARKQQELEDFKKQYSEERQDFDYVLKEKDRQIKKLEKLLETVLEEQAYKHIIDQNDSFSEEQSSPSLHKALPKLKVENKAQVNFNHSNLFKHSQSETAKERNTYQSTERMRDEPKAKINSQKNLYDIRNYESEHEKKVKPAVQLSSSSYTNLDRVQNEKNKERQRQALRKASIKKVDSMISLKPLKRDPSLKLPFITEVKKLTTKKVDSQHDYSEKSEYTNKLSLDIARIKDEIINELKAKSKAR